MRVSSRHAAAACHASVPHVVLGMLGTLGTLGRLLALGMLGTLAMLGSMLCVLCTCRPMHAVAARRRLGQQHCLNTTLLRPVWHHCVTCCRLGMAWTAW